MNIAAGTLLKIVPLGKRGKIPGPAALQIVHRQFCGPMTIRGFCTSQCQDCKASLLSAFTLDGANNEQAVLTWRLKSELAKVQDRPEQHEPVTQVDRFGLPVPERNPFETMHKQYEKQAQKR